MSMRVAKALSSLVVAWREVKKRLCTSANIEKKTDEKKQRYGDRGEGENKRKKTCIDVGRGCAHHNRLEMLEKSEIQLAFAHQKVVFECLFDREQLSDRQQNKTENAVLTFKCPMRSDSFTMSVHKCLVTTTRISSMATSNDNAWKVSCCSSCLRLSLNRFNSAREM